eukprot:jgi/Mesvir1/1958/Mv12442-RA.1
MLMSRYVNARCRIGDVARAPRHKTSPYNLVRLANRLLTNTIYATNRVLRHGHHQDVKWKVLFITTYRLTTRIQDAWPCRTDTKAYNSIRWRVTKLQDSRILVIPSLIANKRRQMMLGVKAAKTPYIVFVDDDVIFPERAMAWILAPFAVGAVGTSQIARPSAETVRLRKGKMTVWEIMADIRLQLRFVENASTQVLDGGISCLSGRTAAYRRCIFTPQFKHEFTNEFWMGRKLHSGDDKFLTRWVVKDRWKTALQIHEDCLIQTTFRADSRFLKQVLRWSRNTWRSDFK